MTTLPAGWKPISSAPKDGTPVLAFWTGGTEAATVYGRSYGITMFKHGEWVNVDNCDDTYSEPTHWMPLPVAPGTPPASAQDDVKEASFNPEKCDQEVFERGVFVGLFDIPKHVANDLCKGISSATGTRVDWHYFGGRVRVMALPAPAAGDARDTERLEFLVRLRAWIGWSKDRECCAVYRRDDEGYTEPMTGWSPSYLTPREAIDAAIAASQQQEG